MVGAFRGTLIAATLLCVASTSAHAVTISFAGLTDNPGNGEVAGNEFNGQGFMFSTPTLALNVGCGSGSACLGADLTTVNDFRGTLIGTFVVPATAVPAIATDLQINYCCEANSGSTNTRVYGPGNVLVATFTDSDVSYLGQVIRFEVDLGFDAMRSLTYANLAPEACGNGGPNPGEQCDDGNFANGDCCSSTCQYEAAGSPCATDGEACTADVCDGAGACTHAAGNSGTTCRAAVDTCDLAELCDGASPTCPADVLVDSGTSCRAAADLCDAEELCSGVSPLCPADGMLAGGTECRTVAGDCDLAEQCDGASPACPADLKSTDPCRPAADMCDLAESCDGVTDDCPADGFAAMGTPCRADAGDCDLAEACTGSSAACPADAKETDGTGCDDADTCSQTDTCQAGVCTGTDPLDCDDGNGCTADSCDPMGGCVNDDAPAASCLSAGKSIVLIKDHATDDGKDKLLFKWIKGAETSQMDFSDPVATAAYALCVYAGTTNALIADAALPPGPSWSAIGTKGYKFKGTSPDGLSLAILKGGAAGKSKALAKGKGAALPDATLPVSYPVTVQIKKDGSPLCLESVFTSLHEKKNTAAQFKAKN